MNSLDGTFKSTVNPMVPPTLKENETGIGVPGKGTVNNVLSPASILSFLFDEVPEFPIGISNRPQLRINLFLRLPPFKPISYFIDTSCPKILAATKFHL